MSIVRFYIPDQLIPRSLMKVLHIIPSLSSCCGGPSEAALSMVSGLLDLGLDAHPYNYHRVCRFLYSIEALVLYF